MPSDDRKLYHPEVDLSCIFTTKSAGPSSFDAGRKVSTTSRYPRSDRGRLKSASASDFSEAGDPIPAGASDQILQQKKSHAADDDKKSDKLKTGNTADFRHQTVDSDSDSHDSFSSGDLQQSGSDFDAETSHPAQLVPGLEEEHLLKVSTVTR